MEPSLQRNPDLVHGMLSAIHFEIEISELMLERSGVLIEDSGMVMYRGHNIFYRVHVLSMYGASVRTAENWLRIIPRMDASRRNEVFDIIMQTINN